MVEILANNISPLFYAAVAPSFKFCFKFVVREV